MTGPERGGGANTCIFTGKQKNNLKISFSYTAKFDNIQTFFRYYGPAQNSLGGCS
jgi:hypothetical protein